MMKAVSTSETSVNFYQTARRNMPEDNHLHTRRRENLKSHRKKHVYFFELTFHFWISIQNWHLKRNMVIPPNFCILFFLFVLHVSSVGHLYLRGYILRYSLDINTQTCFGNSDSKQKHKEYTDMFRRPSATHYKVLHKEANPIKHLHHVYFHNISLKRQRDCGTKLCHDIVDYIIVY
jgi:hypothetical protein